MQGAVGGTSKTRLSPPLSQEEAASLSRCFIADIAATVGALAPDLNARGFVMFTPPEAHGAFEGVAPAGFGMLPQRGNNLSECCQCDRGPYGARVRRRAY